MNCCICEVQIDSVEEGIDQGWILNFRSHGKEENGPVCIDCIESYLQIYQDQEIENDISVDSPVISYL